MFPVEEHWKFFAEFCHWEIKAGGPDPHMRLAVELSKGKPFMERLWRGGCYIAVYNAPFGEAIWRAWPWERVVTSEEALLPWLQTNWKKIVTRRERRCVRRPEWMLEYLLGYAKFVRQVPDLIAETKNLTSHERYFVFWDAALCVPRLGRYVALKLMEFLRYACGIDIVLPDLRPDGGWSPREMLGVLWPNQKRVASRDNSPALLRLANTLAWRTQARLRDEFDLDLDMFQVQVLLCDYKQSWKSQRQYPGRSIDSELMYVCQAEEFWGYTSEIWEARKRLFPPEHLGELNGWEGPREGPASVLATHKYTWSDLRFDYRLTSDFAVPVVRVYQSAAAPPCNRIHSIIPGRLFQSCSWNEFSPSMCKALVAHYALTGIVSVWQGEHNSLAAFIPKFTKHPLADGKVVPWDEIKVLVESIAERIKLGERILVMCHAGRNRSALITALVVRALYRCSGDEAVQLVRSQRPRALANEAFASYVSKLLPPPPNGQFF